MRHDMGEDQNGSSVWQDDPGSGRKERRERADSDRRVQDLGRAPDGTNRRIMGRRIAGFESMADGGDDGHGVS